jgi:hypothetical protein
VAKSCRGRGSAGVKLCKTAAELSQHVEKLYVDSSVVMPEEFLQGGEATVTVMPSSSSKSDHWAMPLVTRFNHKDGIAPYRLQCHCSRRSGSLRSDCRPTVRMPNWRDSVKA